ncbi:MAG TPA: hypothetical protein EYN66_23755, partial [Myxococcales bacterium]|nr:hypothetical protein [Myxococcales bacterium]
MTKFAFTGCLLFCLALALLGCPDDKTAEEACKNLKDVCPLGTKFELSASSLDTCNADLSEGNLLEGAGLTISGSCDSIGSCVYACTHEPCCLPSHKKITQPDGTVTETYNCEIPPNADGECVNAGDLCDPPCGPGAKCTTNGECHCGEAGASCDDGDKCTDGDSCSEDGSSCDPGPAKDCSDGNVCTGNETCEPDTGNCTAGPPPQCGNYACDITSGCKDSCTLETWAADCAANYGCSDGQCVSNTAENGEDCSSDNACKSVHCQNGFCCDNDKCCNNTGDCGENEQCTGDNLCTCELGTECSDGNACTVNDTCVDAGKVNLCQGTDNTSSCDDGNGCTTDTCDIASGECVSQNNDLACNDGNKCTTGDTCASGACVISTEVVCEGGEKCDSNKGCGQGCSSELDCKLDYGCDTVTSSCVQESLSNGSPCAGNKACDSALCNSQGLCCTSGVICCNTDMPCVPPANKCSGDQLKTLACDEENICIESYNPCPDNFSCDSSSGCMDAC